MYPLYRKDQLKQKGGGLKCNSTSASSEVSSFGEQVQQFPGSFCASRSNRMSTLVVLTAQSYWGQGAHKLLIFRQEMKTNRIIQLPKYGSEKYCM